MKIHGLQKMTLLDFPGRVACTVFTGACDFRCPFCHNFELVDGTAPAIMEDTQLFEFLEKRRGLLDGVAITGGEPCIHKDLPQLLSRIKEMGFAVKLDTNGNNPRLLEQILSEGLVDYVAMDVKNSPEKYAMTIGLPAFDLTNVRESISLLMDGPADYEFRTTVVAQFHEAKDFDGIGELIRGAKHYFLQCFTDRDSVPFEGLSAPSRQDLEAFAAIARKYAADVQLRGID